MSAPSRGRIRTEDSFEGESSQPKKTAGPPVVRKLRPPPEIWELVHPVEGMQIKPSRTLRTSSNSTAILLVTVAAVLMVGIGLIYWKNRHVVKPTPVVASQRAPVAQPAAAEVKTEALPAQQTNAVTNDTNSVAADTSAAPSSTEVSAVQDVASVVKPVRKVKRKETAVVTNSVSTVAPQRSVSSTVSQVPTKPASNIDASATKTKSNAPTNALIEPVKPSTANKPKVIQWP